MRAEQAFGPLVLPLTTGLYFGNLLGCPDFTEGGAGHSLAAQLGGASPRAHRFDCQKYPGRVIWNSGAASIQQTAAELSLYDKEFSAMDGPPPIVRDEGIQTRPFGGSGYRGVRIVGWDSERPTIDP